MAIYARLENGTYAEVTGVYKADGTEVTEIFQGDRLVYSASSEIYGSLPLYYSGKGYDLTDYLISGNAVQDGTPSADAPVDAVGSGVRTGNLVRFFQEEMRGTYYGVDVTVKNAEITLNGTVSAGSGHWVEIGHKFGGGTEQTDNVVIPCKSETAYTIAIDVLDGNSSEVRTITFGTSNAKKTINIGSSLATIIGGDVNRIFISLGAEGVVFNKLKFRIMFNEGSTPLPYEPYGFKLPLTVNGTEYPIYLGTVPTTRRIKKLVLMGEENWKLWEMSASSTTDRFYINISGVGHVRGLCSHFPFVDDSRDTPHFRYGGTRFNELLFWIDKQDASTVADFKQYLATQYSNGTPVTVWYVLAEPETGIVNEPLMKIDDYADTISFAQAGVTIPTVIGENVLDMTSPVKPSEVYIKGKGIKPTGYGQLTDVNSVNILDKDGRPIKVHGQ